jgi:hypothetical protein
MRILAVAIIWTISIGLAAAQTYAPGYPFCLRAQGNYECTYTTLAQCNASASGRAAPVLHQSICERGRAREKSPASPRLLKLDPAATSIRRKRP